MKIHSLLCLFATVLAMPAAIAETPAPPTRSILVLDASGSMWGRIDGRAKIEIAREVIAGLIDDLPQGTEIGLVAYGHRTKGDCADIELLIPPGPLDKQAFKTTVNALTPKGMTPLTAAVVFAAEQLKSSEQKATVILVTDGEETCERDPCEAAKNLEETGVDFTAHVVAFDLTAKAARTIECLATSTGGLFLKADNATTLADALRMAVEPEAAPEPEEAPGEATVAGPETVIAGAIFEATWTGPDAKGDYLTIVPKDAEDGTYQNYEYTRGGSPLKITSILQEGPAEIRYMHGRTRKVLARSPIQVVPAEVSLKGPESAVAGAAVVIEWTGPNNKGDYLTIVPASAEDGTYAQFGYTKDGSPLKVAAPVEPGDCEVRYMAGQGGKVLARIPIKITAAEVSLKGPESAVAGAAVVIEWTGPNNKGDYLTIVPASAEDGTYEKFGYTKDGSPLKVTAPIEPGDCEVRYMSGQGRKVLARIPIKITAADVSIKGPESAVAGAAVVIEWTGPNNKGDYLTIVPASAEDGTYAKFGYTKDGSPLKVAAPVEPGDCEVRYMAGQGGKVLARIPIKITAADVSLKVPESAAAGTDVPIQWTGPNNEGDYITIVPKNAEDGTYAQYDYTREGSPLKVTAPAEPGDCEVRYMSGQGAKVLARIPIKVTPPTEE